MLFRSHRSHAIAPASKGRRVISPTRSSAVKADPVKDEPAVASTAQSAAKPAAKSQPQKAEPVKAPACSFFVREGLLHENIVRLSKENGWNAPEWTIPSDFKVSSSFSVSAKSFPEAMAKLLMLHPIEADINTDQRKVYVTKEVQ